MGLNFEICASGIDGGAGPSSLEAAAVPNLPWQDPVMTVRFLNGSPALRQRVFETATDWVPGTALRFEVVDGGFARIRIDLSPSGRYESAIGRQALSVSANEPTMFLGFPDPADWNNEYRGRVLHEFGHAIGLIHEHQSPTFNVEWRRQTVLAHYANLGRDEEWVMENVFRRLTNATLHTPLDPHSIMMYAFPPEFTLNGFSTPWNNELTGFDRALAARLYSTD